MTSDNVALALGISRADVWMRKRIDPALGALHAIGYTDFQILAELGAVLGGRLRRVDLANRLLLTASGVTRALPPLENMGLVEREAHERDARASYVRLTAAGRTRLEAAMPTVERIVAEAVGSSITRADRLALLGLFERLAYL
jgi:DNA-binding MarR family transcriptional regulator